VSPGVSVRRGGAIVRGNTSPCKEELVGVVTDVSQCGDVESGGNEPGAVVLGSSHERLVTFRHGACREVLVAREGDDAPYPVDVDSRVLVLTARGELNEVKGPGVVGEQPVLRPGESFEYTSGAPLNTPWGMMGGSYQMESESGERFDIEIPTFSLDSPNQGVMLN